MSSLLYGLFIDDHVLFMVGLITSSDFESWRAPSWAGCVQQACYRHIMPHAGWARVGSRRAQPLGGKVATPWPAFWLLVPAILVGTYYMYACVCAAGN